MGAQRNKILFKKLLVCLLALAVASAMLSVSQFHSDKQEHSKTTDSVLPINERPLVVIRIDDIQDRTWRDVQISLIEYNLDIGIPMSLAVIPKYFGEDKELVELVSSAIKRGSEITAHGWSTEVLTEYDLGEQTRQLQLAREKLKYVLGVDVSVMTPPYFVFHNDTLLAMKKTKYTILSSEITVINAGLVYEDIVSIPATVQFSNYVNDTWEPKSPEFLAMEISRSIRLHGYAVILIHPQEFLQGNEFDLDRFEAYKALVRKMRENCSFTVIEKFRDSVVSKDKF